MTARIRRLRRLGRALLLLRRTAVLISIVIGVLASVILVDYALRLPGALRLLLLAGGVTALAAALLRYVRPAFTYRPDVTSMALRIERAVPALRGRLASAVEFAAAGVDRENPLAARAVAEAERRASGALDGLVRMAPAMRQAGIALAVVAVGLLLSAWQPTLARTGLTRVLLPLAGAEWPARTAIEPQGDGRMVHARGLPLPLRAILTLGDPDRTRVVAMVRTIDESVAGGRPGQWRALVMTHQGDAIFERLVDTDADAIEFSFATDDATTATQRIELVAPPAIRRATLVVDPPTYVPVPEGSASSLELELGPGTDARASVATPLLEGSAVTLRLHLSGPVPVPIGEEREAWLRTTIGRAPDDLHPLPALHVGDAAESDLAAPGPAWTLTWQLRGTTTLTMNLVDEHGITNIDDIIYRIVAVSDREPTATIAKPAADEPVAPTAVVPVTVEARDDIGVALVGLEVTRRRADEAPALVSDQSVDGRGPSERLATSLSMADLSARPGDVLVLQGFAEDAFELDGERHPRARSTERRLRVVGEMELAEQLRRALAGVRQAAIRVDAQQVELAEAVERLGNDGSGEPRDADADRVEAAATARAQAQVGDRLAQQAATINEIRERLERNRLDDDELESTLELALDRLAQAGAASNEAAEQLEAREDEAAAEAQREVRDELAGLIELLDRDEDTWLVTRRMEGLQDRLEELREATSRLGERTVGQPRESLPAAELSELERIAAAQRDAADDAAALLEELRRRGQPRDGAQDPQAGVLREAARTGEERDLEGQMREAAGELDANRMANAEQRQAEAEATLREMMEEVQDGRRARSRELARQLASLTESIRQLVRRQEDELIALARAEGRDAFDERSREMGRLTQNTLGVADEARASGPSGDRAARFLGRATEAQGEAIRALRSEPANIDGATAAEEQSLELLQEALTASAEAQERAEEEDARRERSRLLEAYRESLNRQSDLIDETARIGDADGRRALLEARRVGGVQQQIRESLHEIRVGSEAVSRSLVLDALHDRMDAWSRAAEEVLGRGDSGVAAMGAMELLRDSLARIVESLSREDQEDDPFDDGGAGEQGGGGGAGEGGAEAIPPRAELRLLRGLQEQIYDRTRQIDAAPDAPQRASELRDLAERQREIADLARRMIESLQGGEAIEPPERGVAPENEP